MYFSFFLSTYICVQMCVTVCIIGGEEKTHKKEKKDYFLAFEIYEYPNRVYRRSLDFFIIIAGT